MIRDMTKSTAPQTGLTFSGSSNAAHSSTLNPGFERLKEYLSTKPRRRSVRSKPSRNFSQQQLLELATKHPPPPEWFQGEDECPFLAD